MIKLNYRQYERFFYKNTKSYYERLDGAAEFIIVNYYEVDGAIIGLDNLKLINCHHKAICDII